VVAALLPWPAIGASGAAADAGALPPPVGAPTAGAAAPPATGAAPVRAGRPVGAAPSAADAANELPASARPPARLPPPATEFERWLRAQPGLGDLRSAHALLFAAPEGSPMLDDTSLAAAAPRVPADHRLRAGDELRVTVWGSLEADLRLVLDRDGRVVLPRVGSVALAGVRADAVEGLLRERVAREFRGFELVAGVGAVRPIEVLVTGFVERPGLKRVPGLATLSAAALRVVAPLPGGSLRRVELLRGGDRVVAELDLLRLLVEGRQGSTEDPLLQPGDRLHVPGAGPQVAVVGSVHRPAIYELREGETAADLLRFGGGFAALADRGRVALDAFVTRSAAGARELRWPEDSKTPLAAGDVLHVFGAAGSALPGAGRTKRVRIDGEVLAPGEYLLPAGATIADAVARAGGLTPEAHPFGAQLLRESVRRTQQANLDRALRDLETEVLRGGGEGPLATQAAPEAGRQRQQAALALLAKLRDVGASGRVVLAVSPQAATLPALPLEDADHLHVPARSSSVGVFGSVRSSGSFVHDGRRTLADYLAEAGGPTPGADTAGGFVVRANGSVVGGAPGGGFFARLGAPGPPFADLKAEPGDTLFVPEAARRGAFAEAAKDWTQILYQLGLGVAALKVLR
jgi:protein involved in polysaccharide export with SLBB domain